MSQKKEKKQRKVWKGVMRWLALGVGWGLVLIFTVALFVLILTVNMEEERLTHVVEVANALERWLQTIPLCSCTYSSRGGTYFLPLCRACRPQVIWYENTNSAIGVGADRHRLCDYRPGWMLGTCQRSTESVKYLGRFGTSEECEAACLSYNVGTSVCRSFLYHRSSYPERRFRQSCFGTTHNGWDAQTEPEVDSGRVFGPLAQVQRMLVWYVRQVRQRIEARWWIDGRPWEVLVAVFVAVMIHAAIVTGVAQRRASNSTGSNGSKFPASPGLVLRSSSSPSLRLIPGLSSPSPSAPSRKNSSASSPVSPQVLMLSSGREHYRHKTGGGSPPYRSRAMKPPREREREPGNGAGAGAGGRGGGSAGG